MCWDKERNNLNKIREKQLFFFISTLACGLQLHLSVPLYLQLKGKSPQGAYLFIYIAQHPNQPDNTKALFFTNGFVNVMVCGPVVSMTNKVCFILKERSQKANLFYLGN